MQGKETEESNRVEVELIASSRIPFEAAAASATTNRIEL